MGTQQRNKNEMKVLLVAFALVATALAQTDDVPKDRCGLVASSNEDGRLEIFVLGHDNQIYHKYQMDGTEWSNWGSLGGKYLRGGPSVVQAADGRLVLSRAVSTVLSTTRPKRSPIVP